MKSEHHVEAFREDGTPGYGWQCFTCGEEKKGFALVPQAEADALSHGILPHQYRIDRLLEVPDEDDVFPEWDVAAELADDARRGK